MRNELKRVKNQLSDFCNFSFLDIADFVPKFRKKFILGGLRPPKPPVLIENVAPHTTLQGLHPQVPDAYGLKTTSQLVLWYHWIAFLYQVPASPTKKYFFLF